LTTTPSQTATLTATVTPSQTATVTPSLTSTLTITPSVTSSPTITPDLTLTAQGTEIALAELAVIKEETDGDTIRITIENNGAGDANNLQLQENLRPGVYYVSSRPGEPLCIESSGIVGCGLGTLRSGDTTSVDITLSTVGTDILSGQTTVSADGIASITLDAPYLIKVGQPPFAQPGETITYTLRVINPTGNTASTIMVRDTMPDAVTIESGQSSSGQLSFDGQDVVFTQTQLEPGGRISITIVTRLRDNANAVEIVNEACLTSSENANPSCANFGFFRASQLPTTGQSPLSKWRLPMLTLGVLAMATILLLALRRSTST
jgi:uncharacterized repeat protein (TIGR01451 family)